MITNDQVEQVRRQLRYVTKLKVVVRPPGSDTEDPTKTWKVDVMFNPFLHIYSF